MYVQPVYLSAILSNQYMHIPDGYLSPATSAVMFLLMLPFWARGVRSLRQKMTARNMPLIALFAAFSFVIMMFNVPVPGGTTAHAVGGALAAVILGPEIATVAVSIALIIQALFFGDGGILAFGANCFNMAVVLPYVSYFIYQAVAGRSAITSQTAGVGLGRRRLGRADRGGACAPACEFGIQPALFHAADGTPLYAPYPLAVSVPAMVIPHAAVASVAEGAADGAGGGLPATCQPGGAGVAGPERLGRRGDGDIRQAARPMDPVAGADRPHPARAVGAGNGLGRMGGRRADAARAGLRAAGPGRPARAVGRPHEEL